MGNLERSFTERGHQVHVVSRADFPRLMWREMRLSAFVLWWPWFRRSLGHFDVVNVHGPVPSMSDAFLVLGAALRGPRPAIVYTHHSDLAIPGLSGACSAYNWLAYRLARRADAVLVSSADYAKRFRPDPDKPVAVVPWGIDSRARPRAVGVGVPGPLRVLFVGQLRPYKGLHVLLDAVAGLGDVELTVIGGGPQLGELRARVAAQRLTNVRILGRVSDDELWDAYSEHDVIVLPSLTTAEAFGLVLLEGMAAGCVPVASALPGVREVSGHSGMLVPPGDANALRRTLLHLARNRDVLTERAAQSVRFAEARSLQVTAQLHEAVFQSTVQRVLNRRATALLPERWSDPHELLDAVADCVGTERVSISLVSAGSHSGSAAVLQRNRSFARWSEAPLVRYAAHHETAVLIDGWKAPEPELVPLLRRPELASAIIMPVRRIGSSMSVLSVATTQADCTVLRHRHLGRILTVLEKQEDEQRLFVA